MSLYYWDIRDAGQPHDDYESISEQLPDEFGTIEKLRTIIPPENIFFQCKAKPSPNNQHDFEELQRLYECIQST